MINMNEIWKTIDGFKDYMISSLGRVKSLKFGKERILKQSKDGSGYFRVCLHENKKRKYKEIHSMVYEAFKNKLEKGYVVHHINENKEYNIIYNLESKLHSKHIGDHNKGKKFSEKHKKNLSHSHIGKKHSEERKRKQSEVMKEKYKNGELKSQKGEDRPMSILKNQDILDIRKLCYEKELTQKEIGKRFGVCQITISKIKLNKTWKHIKDDLL